MTRAIVLRLTWAGFDAAVDVLDAISPRGVEMVCGMDRGGMLLAWALSERLGIECTTRPGVGALLVHGVVEREPRVRRPGTSVLAWVDATPGQSVQSVCKASAGTQVLMPWQDAIGSPRPFVPRLDD